MAKKNITKNDEKKASRAVVDTKSLDGSTRSGGIDRSGAALPLAYRKLNTALELTFSLADDPLFVESHLATVKAHSGNPRYLPDFERLPVMVPRFRVNSLL